LPKSYETAIPECGPNPVTVKKHSPEGLDCLCVQGIHRGAGGQSKWQRGWPSLEASDGRITPREARDAVKSTWVRVTIKQADNGWPLDAPLCYPAFASGAIHDQN
jgi:hypothetical protein